MRIVNINTSDLVAEENAAEVERLTAEVTRLRAGLANLEANCRETASEFARVPGGENPARLMRTVASAARAYLDGGEPR